MTKQKAIGAAIALGTTLGAATGLVVGWFHAAPAIGVAMSGIVIGFGVARGMFSTMPRKKI